MATHRVWVERPGLDGGVQSRPLISALHIHRTLPLTDKLRAFILVKFQQIIQGKAKYWPLLASKTNKPQHITEISKKAYTHTAITTLASFMRDHHHLHPFTQMLLREQEKHWVCSLDSLNSLNNVVYSTIICYTLQHFGKKK